MLFVIKNVTEKTEEKTTIYSDREYAQISWNEALKCVVGRWKKFATGNNFQEPLDKGLELLQKKKTAKWLADTRKLGVISKKTRSGMTRIGFRDLSWPRQVCRNHCAGRNAGQNVIRRHQRDQKRHEFTLTVKNFSTIEKAITWLKSQG